jgi:hypothetical protein
MAYVYGLLTAIAVLYAVRGAYSVGKEDGYEAGVENGMKLEAQRAELWRCYEQQV